jgi:hypothetical protein
MFGSFENINWKKELKIKIQNITKGRERSLIIDGVCIANQIY